MSENRRLQLIISIAKLYYIENMNQNQIATLMGVSRPLISKYLMEARNLGIVKIEVNDVLADNNDEEKNGIRLCEKFGLKKVYSIPYSSNKDFDDQIFIDYSTEYLLANHNEHSIIGIGWGSTIGSIVKKSESLGNQNKITGTVVPLIGNAPISYRNYHTNELVRMLADSTGLNGDYLYAPVICSTAYERDIFVKTENVERLMSYYKSLDVAIIQIRNFPSVPDLATEARFGKKLNEKKAVGMILSYYYDIDGNVITSDTDFSIQISLESLKCSKNVIGIVNSRVNNKAVIGALKTGIFTHLIISDSICKELI